MCKTLTMKTMKTRAYITIIITVLGMALFAQDVDSLQFKIRRASSGIGYSKLMLLDEGVSDTRLESINAPFFFCYSIQKEKTIFEYNFNGIIGYSYHPETGEVQLIGPSSGLSILQQAYVRYYYNIPFLSPENFRFNIGGEVREQFFINFADAPTFTFAELGLHLSLLLSYQFNSVHSIKTYLGWPAVGTRVNLPNANMDDILENGPDGSFSDAEFSLMAPWTQRGANFSIEYVRQLSGEWSLGCAYEHYSYRLEEKNPVRFGHGGLVMKLTRTL